MAASFLFEHSFNVNSNFLSWAGATTGAGGFQGIANTARLHYVANDAILTTDDEVVIAVALFAGQEITVDVDFGNNAGDNSIDLEAWIIDSNGNFVSQDDSGALDPGSSSIFDPNFSFTATTSGLYFIALSHWVNNYQGNFTFEDDGTDTGDFQVDISTADFGVSTLGSNANDTIDRRAFFTDDRIVSLGGHDTIYAGTGNNSVDAGDGNDKVYGGDQSDQIYGDLGNDLLVGADGYDILVGGSGDDVLQGGDGNDTILGGGGTDTASYEDSASGVTVNLANNLAQNTGGSGFDILRNIEIVVGSAFKDNITGSRRDNVLNGQDGNDNLSGGNGEDRLIGGLGKDRLTGGAKDDVFDYNSVAEMGTGTGRDVIVDFKHLKDLIDLRTIDANSTAGGNQDFRFIGSSSFSGHAGELRFVQTATQTFVYVDVNGDGIADGGIILNGIIPLSGGDFLL